MWIFGYGSLMWDGWERDFGRLRAVMAELPGHQRVFNKASIRNWGTRTAPGPTLNLVPGHGVCRGIAFEFQEQASAALHDYLLRREGRDFALRNETIRLNDGEGGCGDCGHVPRHQSGSCQYNHRDRGACSQGARNQRTVHILCHRSLRPAPRARHRRSGRDRASPRDRRNCSVAGGL